MRESVYKRVHWSVQEGTSIRGPRGYERVGVFDVPLKADPSSREKPGPIRLLEGPLIDPPGPYPNPLSISSKACNKEKVRGDCVSNYCFFWRL